MTNPKITVYLEVLLSRRPSSSGPLRHSQIRQEVSNFIRDNYAALRLNWAINPAEGDDCKQLAQKVERISVAQVVGMGYNPDIVPINDECALEMHIYRLEDGEEATGAAAAAEKVSVDEDGTVSAMVWSLPGRAFDGLWDSLIFDDDDLKNRLLRYMSTVMLFSERGVNPNIVSFNRMILLHGPPGTGKTTLCRALAQKLTIRLSKSYLDGRLFEISAHSLFSKWFSESGKLVGKLFERIRAVIDDTGVFVCLLIDEIESLTMARKSSGNEPSDAMRVVNAVLTELDKLRSAKNVLILATSNLIDAMDPVLKEVAFLDRVDVKQYVGFPTTAATYEILRSCILELSRHNMISLSYPPPGEVVSDGRRGGARKDQAEWTRSQETDSSSVIEEDFETLVDLHHAASSDTEDQDGRYQERAGGRRRIASASATTTSTKGGRFVSYEGTMFARTVPVQQRIEQLIPSYAQASLSVYSKPQAYSSRLCGIAKECEGLSGRKLRKLIVLAHARYVQSESSELSQLLDSIGRVAREELTAERGRAEI